MATLPIIVQILVGGLGIGGLYALVALGYSLLYRAMGLVNFAHGSIYMIGTYFGMIFYMGMVGGLHLPYALCFVLGVLLTGLLGIILERVFRPLADLDLMLMLLGTIGVGVVIDNLAIFIWGAQGFAVPHPLGGKPLKIAGVAIQPQMILILLVSAVLMVALNVFLKRSRIGKGMRAAAQDREIAAAMGIPVNLTNALTFAIGSGLAAAAGILAAPIVYVSPAMGGGVGVKGFAAAILGGMGSIPGAIVGGLLIGVLEGYSSAFISSEYTPAIIYAVMVAVLMIKPSGIVGETTVEKV
ncbi:MAG: branched-chain amino acid ABC transporter permease [Anaerolineales bacterium]|nr:branched-chain amino acid ABC transporter permease [Anaerolineales bacterium]